MRQLIGVTSSEGSDLDVILSEDFHLVDQLRHISETVSEKRIADIIPEGLSGRHDLVEFNRDNVADCSLEESNTYKGASTVRLGLDERS